MSTMQMPPIGILAPSEPPPAVAILPLKEEPKTEQTTILPLPEKMEVKDVKPPVSTILPQIPNYSTPILPLPSL